MCQELGITLLSKIRFTYLFHYFYTRYYFDSCCCKTLKEVKNNTAVTSIHIRELCSRCFGMKYKTSQIAANENKTICADLCCLLKVNKAGIWQRTHESKFQKRHLLLLSGVASAAELNNRI